MLDAIYSCRIDGTDVEKVSVQSSSPNALAWVFPNTETEELGIGPLEILEFRIEDNRVSISWNARTGQNYNVFASDNFAFSDPPLSSILDYKFSQSEIHQTTDPQFYVVAEE